MLTTTTASTTRRDAVDQFAQIVARDARREIGHMTMEGLVDQLASMKRKLGELEVAGDTNFQDDRKIERLKIRIEVFEEARLSRLRRAKDSGC